MCGHQGFQGGSPERTAAGASGGGVRKVTPRSHSGVKQLGSLGRDPVRDEPKPRRICCAYAYVLTNLNVCQLHQQPSPSPFRLHQSCSPGQDKLSFELQPGERRGWWEANSWDDSACSVAFVHGSVFHHRTLLMLDSGPSASIISLNLARRLKLRSHEQVPGQNNPRASGGVHSRRLGREHWPRHRCPPGDELRGRRRSPVVRPRRGSGAPRRGADASRRGPKLSHLGRTVDVSIHESLWLAPGVSKYIPTRTSEPDLGSMDVWVSRGDRWVTLVVFSAKRVPVAVRVVNISRKPAQVLPYTKAATLTDRDRLPLGTNFVRPGSYQ
ncbi:LOW QUALITY PROTEIN: hypothetical protein PHMEG_00015657 [Phytophthora megakarya]|uniref:Eukaryotic/viral aspartic protease n=1 Tax=Phytophthora megakarya TaxID=4795 RepID=A0A225W0W0_9STRA|nr:LOW QUALITY PROTEIN: hypothetical protein PHMEG_00015657 [Phytophthora megakarya]